MRTITAFTLALVLLGGIAYIAKPSATSLQSAINISDANLAGRTIVDFGTNTDGTVSYSYLDAPVPKMLVPNEVRELRTENSYTKFVEVVGEEKDPIFKLESVFYAQPAYAQDVDGSWKYLEYATTTEQAFRNRDTGFFGRIAEVFVRTAYADSESPFSGAGDGQIEHHAAASEEGFCDIFSTWTTATLANTGTPTPTNTTMYAYAHQTCDTGGAFWLVDAYLGRSFLPFNTVAIPADATITAASLNAYVVGKLDGTLDGSDYVAVARTSQATHTTLVGADFDNTATANGSNQININSGVTVGAYLSFTLNATGRGWIAKSGEASVCSGTAGITCLGIREGHDLAETAPGVTVTPTYANFATSEDNTGGGTDRDPYLAVTYTVPGSGLTKGLLLGGGGSKIQVVGGGLKIY